MMKTKKTKLEEKRETRFAKSSFELRDEKKAKPNPIEKILVFAILAAAILLIVFSFTKSADQPFGVREMKVGDTTSAGGFEFKIRDLSDKAAVVIVSKSGQTINAFLLLSKGTPRTVGKLQLTLQEINRSSNMPASALISFEPISITPSGGALTEEQAMEKFSGDFPEYPESSVSITTGPCRNAQGYCYIISGYRRITLTNAQGQQFNFLEGTIAYFDVNDGKLVYAFKTN